MCEPRPGEFQKSFSPLFALRGFVVKHDPSVLTRLVLWNARRYVDSGVHYAEMSVGAGWFENPYLEAILDGITRAENEHGVLIRLLLAFNRTKISQRIHNPTYLRQLARLGDQKLSHTHESEHFENHLTELSRAKRSLQKHSRARRRIVGFDIVGNEENRPYTPFLLWEFLDFASEMKSENPNFGFRLHLGEGISSDNDIGYVSLRLGEHYVSTLSRMHQFRLRAGHGLGLLGLSDSAFNRWEHYPIMRGPAARRVQENLRIAPIEINLTSNYYLMRGFTSDLQDAQPLKGHVMGSLLREGFNLVLGTDDPGVFPNVSLRGEFQKAFRNELITKVGTFRSIVEESIRASFADPSTIKLLSKIISSRYSGVVVPQDKHTIPGNTAIDEPSVSDRGYPERKRAEFDRAMEASRAGNPHLIEAWFNEHEPP
jgi:adenosine deaminase